MTLIGSGGGAVRSPVQFKGYWVGEGVEESSCRVGIVGVTSTGSGGGGVRSPAVDDWLDELLLLVQ